MVKWGAARAAGLSSKLQHQVRDREHHLPSSIPRFGRRSLAIWLDPEVRARIFPNIPENHVAIAAAANAHSIAVHRHHHHLRARVRAQNMHVRIPRSSVTGANSAQAFESLSVWISIVEFTV